MTDDNKVIYRATANPNATNSELDAKINYRPYKKRWKP